MLFIQVLIVSFVLYVLTRTFLRFRRRSISAFEWAVWSVFWLAVGVFVMAPQVTQRIANILGVGRGADAMFYLGLVGLSYAFFRIYLRSRHLEQQLTLLVRKLAIERAKEEKERPE